MSDTPNPRRSTRKASQPLRLIHAGLGGWGRDWLKVVRAEPGVRTVAWVEPDERSREAAVQAGVPEGNLHPTLAAALAAGAADALLITAPAAAHVPLALEGLSAGLHVLTEKPFAPSVAEARQAIEAADRAGRVLMVSQNYRHHPAPRAARALVASGELGRVGVVNVDFRFDLTGRPANPYLTSYQPLLLDMAIHHFDLVRYLLGEDPVLVDCRAFSPPWSPFRDPAAATAVLEFPSGAVVSYRASWVSPSPRTNWAGDWRVECEGGEVSWTSRDDQSVGAADRVAVRRRGRKTARALTLPVVEKYDRSGTLAEFATAIREGREPESSGRDNLATLATSLAAIRSATEGRPVSLEEVLGA